MAMVVFPEPPFGLITSVVFIIFIWYSNDIAREHDATPQQALSRKSRREGERATALALKVR
jgi:hypothetical protein